MLPILALIYCTAFVLFLLRLERKQLPNKTMVLWIPTIWMLYTASKPLSSWFPSLGGNLESGSSVDRAFLIVLMCVALWILAQRRYNWLSAMKENKWLIVLVVYMFFSIFWSDIPYISFRRWIREFQAVLMAFVVQSEPSPRQAIESILRRTTYILIPFSLLLIRYFPAYGRLYGRWFGEEEWIGVALQKNGLGRLCIIAAFFLIWSLVRRHQGHNPPIWKYQTHTEIFVLVIAFRLLGGPGGYIFSAATAIYAFCAAMLTYWGYSLLKKSGNKMPAGILITVVAIIIIIGIATFFNAASNAKFLASVARRNATLTGRTEIWAKLLPIAIQRPLLGRGFGGFWTSVTRKEIATEGHSGYLDVLLDLGFVGILLVSTFLFSSCLKADRELKRDFDWGVLWIGFLIMAVVHNITESSINSLTSQLIAIILFLTVSSTKIYLPREQT